MEIGSPVLVKKFFEGFSPHMYMSMAANLGHVTSIISIIYISMYLKAYLQNMVKNGPVVSEKSMF